jgi:hypothetical protein
MGWERSVARIGVEISRPGLTQREALRSEARSCSPAGSIFVETTAV